MIIVHHLENSRSQRVLWLLEELELPYEVKRYARDPRTMLAPPELKRVHPLGKSPVIEDDGQVFAETGAIVERLACRYGGGRLTPAEGSPERTRYSYWMHYAEGSAMPPLLMKLVFSVMPQRAPALLRPMAKAVAGRALRSFADPQVRMHMDYWEAELSRHTWFAGEAFTAADIMMSFPLDAAAARADLAADHPCAMHFLQRIHERPAYRRALERGGAYAYA